MPDVLASALKSVPGPSRNAEALGDIVSRLVVARHGRRGGPGEIVVQYMPEWLGRVQPHVLQRLVETGDRPAVHLLVWAVAALGPHHRGLVSIGVGVGGGHPKSLGPVRSEPLAVLRMESVAERVADYLVRHHPRVPRLGQAEQALAAARGLIHALHVPSIRHLPGGVTAGANQRAISSMRSMAQSRSDSLIISGGASRIEVRWVSLASTPSEASRSQASRPEISANSRPAHRPRPRTSRTASLGRQDSRSCRCAPSLAERSWNSPVDSIAMTSRATAQASGLPPNVEPCWPGLNTPSTSPDETTAETGTMPPPSALPSTYMSGTTSSCSQANVVPVRPSPDWISSAIISALRAEQRSRTPVRKPGGGTMTPASPWIGSTSTATTLSSMASARAPRSPYGTTRKPGVNGPYEPRASSSVEKLMIVVVRPWKLPSKATMTAWPAGTPLTSYPHLRAVLIAVSTASAPVFIGSTISMPASAASSAQNGPNWSCSNALLTSVTRSSCRCAAATSRGCRWPKLIAEYAASMSRYLWPSTSVTQAPSAAEITTGSGW